MQIARTLQQHKCYPIDPVNNKARSKVGALYPTCTEAVLNK